MKTTKQEQHDKLSIYIDIEHNRNG